MVSTPDWINLALVGAVAIVLLVFVWVCVWGVREIKGILDILTRHERARAELRLEEFHAHDTEFVSKFNRNFHRIHLVMGGARTIEHFWSVPGAAVDPNPQLLNGKCMKCGMKMSDFFSAHNFRGCVDG